MPELSVISKHKIKKHSAREEIIIIAMILIQRATRSRIRRRRRCKTGTISSLVIRQCHCWMMVIMVMADGVLTECKSHRFCFLYNDFEMARASFLWDAKLRIPLKSLFLLSILCWRRRHWNENYVSTDARSVIWPHPQSRKPTDFTWRRKMWAAFRSAMTLWGCGWSFAQKCISVLTMLRIGNFIKKVFCQARQSFVKLFLVLWSFENLTKVISPRLGNCGIMKIGIQLKF